MSLMDGVGGVAALQFVAQDENLFYVACIAPRQHTCNVAITLVESL